jgi:hypothetical protein
MTNLTENTDDPIAIFKTDCEQAQIDVQVLHETVWLSQAQMAALFAKAIRLAYT